MHNSVGGYARLTQSDLTIFTVALDDVESVSRLFCVFVCIFVVYLYAGIFCSFIRIKSNTCDN